MIYEQDALPFWEQQKPGPIAKTILIRKKITAEKRCDDIEHEIANIRTHYRAGCPLSREIDRRRMARKADEYSIWEAEIKAFGDTLAKIALRA